MGYPRIKIVIKTRDGKESEVVEHWTIDEGTNKSTVY